MARGRTKEYIDIDLLPKEIKRLKKGYVVLKVVDGKHYAINPNKDEAKAQREISKLKARIRQLEKGTKRTYSFRTPRRLERADAEIVV